MELIYRGIAHELVSASAAIQHRQELQAGYRGLAWSWPSPSAARAFPASFALTYRGIALNSAATVAPGIPAAEAAPSAVVSSRKHLMTLIQETHRQNLLRRLQERIRSAQSRGDEHLLQQLEQERQLLA